ncbi:hypothetical protein BAU06_03875 [Bordetella bronchialis]|nr:hypothetical protein BAU06_03875 [Bordetella bronchialis]
MMPPDNDDLHAQVASRLGLLPDFYGSAALPAGPAAALWAFAKAAYLDIPLPSLLKERLFVHLSRFCEVRYCIVRHVGFLIGAGRPAGDAHVPPLTVQQVMRLLRRPVPVAAQLDRAIREMEARTGPAGLPEPDTADEARLFDALTVLFLAPSQAGRVREGVAKLVGAANLELLTGFLAFVRAAHWWTEMYPQLNYEPDAIACMGRDPALAALMLDGSEAMQAALDRDEHRLAAARLREREADLARVQRIGGVGGIDIDVADGMRAWRSPEYLRLHGLPPDAREETHAQWRARVHPEDRDQAERTLMDALNGESGGYDSEYRIVRPSDGEVRWIHARADIERDADGRAVRLVGAHIDVTESKRMYAAVRESEERQKVLIAELQHRTRNLMGVVRVLADRTARASTSLDDFRARLDDRLAALSRVQGLLSRLDEYDRVTFDELLDTEIAALAADAGRVTRRGPAGVRLRSSTVQTLAMALHELAINAMKYGALAQPSGRLAVQWSLERAGPDGGPWLHVDWRETGVRMPPQAATRMGHGRELIEQALPYQLGARTSCDFGGDGLHCTLSIPVSASTP